jgi:hypothetical protein
VEPQKALSGAWKLGPHVLDWAAERVVERPFAVDPGVFWSRTKRHEDALHHPLCRWIRCFDYELAAIRVRLEGVSDLLTAQFVPMASSIRCSARLNSGQFEHERLGHLVSDLAWGAFVRVYRFIGNPSIETFCDAAESCVSARLSGASAFDGFPWPIRMVADVCGDVDTWREVKERVVSGELGHPDDWVRIESEWLEEVPQLWVPRKGSPLARPTGALYPDQISYASGSGVTMVEIQHCNLRFGHSADALPVGRYLEKAALAAVDYIWWFLVHPSQLYSDFPMGSIFHGALTQFPAAAEYIPSFPGSVWWGAWQPPQSSPAPSPARPVLVSLISQWTRLQLPPPAPTNPGTGARWVSIPPRPVVFSEVHLGSFAGVPRLHLELAPPEGPEEGQWVVLLGPNGVGKTSLLRAVALALRDPGRADVWAGLDRRRMLAHGADSNAQVRLVGQGFKWELTIERGDRGGFRASPPFDHPLRLPLFGYGCRRGSALSGGQRESKPDLVGGGEVATLFHEDAHLLHAEAWLRDWHSRSRIDQSEKSRAAKVVFDAACAGLAALLEAEEVRLDHDGVMVRLPGQAALPLDLLSDGYLTTAGWFVDLLARWIHFCLHEEHPLVPPNTPPAEAGRELLRGIRALVLIDELDLHLHPRWQVEVIPRTRRLLPACSFIVTTHNPATVVGARAEEVWRLERDERGEIIAVRGEVPPMRLSGGELYQAYFGMPSLFPSEVGAWIERLAQLGPLRARDDEEEEEVRDLLAKLAAKQVDHGVVVLPRRVRT